MISIEMTGSQDFGDKTLRQIKVISEKAITDITEIARHEIQANISGARSIYGGLVKPSKKKRGVTLIDTGELLSSVKSEKINPNHYKVFLASGRAKIGSWLHYGTPKMVARPFFGISKITLQRIRQYLLKASIK